MKLSVWFDVKNKNHIESYRYLQSTGFWPRGFVPDHVDIDVNWQTMIMNKLAQLALDSLNSKKDLKAVAVTPIESIVNAINYIKTKMEKKGISKATKEALADCISFLTNGVK